MYERLTEANLVYNPTQRAFIVLSPGVKILAVRIQLTDLVGQTLKNKEIYDIDAPKGTHFDYKNFIFSPETFCFAFFDFMDVRIARAILPPPELSSKVTFKWQKKPPHLCRPIAWNLSQKPRTFCVFYTRITESKFWTSRKIFRIPNLHESWFFWNKKDNFVDFFFSPGFRFYYPWALCGLFYHDRR